MPAHVRERATYEDLLKVPDTMVAELIDGELFASPRPALPHADAVTELTSTLRHEHGPRGRGTWHILFEPELHLGADVLVPDIAGWRTERLPQVPRASAISIPPDWICEALSRSTARMDRERKLPAYARHGVASAWVVDLDLQYLEVKELRGGAWTDVATFGGDAKVRTPPFDEIEIDLTLIWGPPPA
ncbi:MAG TPA: Uma2 family endonuclease [Thermoanaerobaculia bacterium]|nr:Uma2 family endonuclease [Thermoanaerobaculia bacterium]